MCLATPFFIHGAEGTQYFYFVWNNIGGKAAFNFPEGKYGWYERVVLTGYDLLQCYNDLCRYSNRIHCLMGECRMAAFTFYSNVYLIGTGHILAAPEACCAAG